MFFQIKLKLCSITATHEYKHIKNLIGNNGYTGFWFFSLYVISFFSHDYDVPA